MTRTSILKPVVLICFVFGGWAHALSNTEAKIVTFDAPGAVSTVPVSINPAGAIVGQYMDANNAYHGFVRSPRGTFDTFDVPEAGTGPGEGTLPEGINSAGVITGYYTDTSGSSHGFVRTAEGTFRIFDAPGAGIPAGAACTPPIICSNGTQGAAINVEGEIVGQYVDTNDVFHGFLRAPDGAIRTFDAPGAGTASGQGTYITFGEGINLFGTVVGVMPTQMAIFMDSFGVHMELLLLLTRREASSLTLLALMMRE